jgi:Zn-dependent metalloprotease
MSHLVRQPGASVTRLILAGACSSLLALLAPAIGHAQPHDTDLRHLDTDVKAALSQIPDADVAAIGAENIPTFIRGKLGKIDGAVTETSVRASLAKVLPIFKVRDEHLKLKHSSTDELGMSHFRFEQQIDGLDVIGADFVVHVAKDGTIYAANGNARSNHTLPRQPKIGTAAAELTVLQATPSAAAQITDKTKLAYIVSDTDGTVHLAYQVDVSAPGTPPIHDLVFVDAIDGSIVTRHPQVFEAESRSMYDAQNGTNLPGAYISSPSSSSDQAVSYNYSYLDNVYQYYWSTFGRDSYNNGGATLVSSVHYYVSYNNAFWNGAQMVYGDGDGTVFSNLALALDVTGHELTHAVTQSTSGLNYVNESGALNEGISDIFGAMVEASVRGVSANTWKIGEDVYTPNTPGDALRYMNNPTQDGSSKDYYPERYTGSSDNGGVHWNSGIANLAFYLMCEGGTHPRGKTLVNVPAIGVDEAQRVWYRANTVYLTSGSQFIDARAATAQAAKDLYGTQAYTSVHLAWDAVGVPSVTGNFRPINVSSRGYVGTGDQVMIAGFVLSGSSSKSMLIRGVGPTLSQLGVSGVLPDPYLTVYQGSTVVDQNDNWSSYYNASGVASATSQVGAFGLPSGSLDSAVLPTLNPNSYTAIVSGVNGGTGNALVEAYDTDLNNSTQLINISTRAYVSSSSPLIGGFVVNGDGYKQVLIRAVGPTLSQLGVNGAMSDPVLTLYVGSTPIRQNDNWGTEPNASSIPGVASQVGAFGLPSGSADSCLLMNLPPGTYTAVVSGANGSAGVGMIEVYVVQ